MIPAFHLSIGVRSIEESVNFFTRILQAKVSHKDPSGYVNIDFYGNEITLKQNDSIVPNLADFHFGVNLTIGEFEELATHIELFGTKYIEMRPTVVDQGTPHERKKMYLKCPTGYLVELKGYKKVDL